jgi:hypothetical protein
MKYSGADWIESVMSRRKAGFKMSPLGVEVANLLGQLFRGIYHIDKEACRVDWADAYCIEINLSQSLSNFDYSLLTDLVVLCHDNLIRVQLEGKAPGVIGAMFHKRAGREGAMHERMPTIEAATAQVRASLAPGKEN